MATPDLKPCPFCGGEAVTWKLAGLWVVGCHGDYMCMGNINHVTLVHITRRQAIETWNRRANDDRL